MKVTLLWMENQFGIFNKAYFNGRLPMPIMKLSRSRTRLGSMAYRQQRRLFSTIKTDYTIRLSTAYDLQEREWMNVLLHEMIHYELAYCGIKDTSPHGVAFRKRMNELNNRYGWDVKVAVKRQSVSATMPSRPMKPRTILLLKLKDKGCMLSVVHPHYVDQIAQHLCLLPNVAEHYWAQSTDLFFLSFPQVRSLRGHRVSEEEYLKWKERLLSPDIQ